MRYMRNDTSFDDWQESLNSQEHFLLKIAQEVDRLIRNKQKVLMRFRQGVTHFVKKANAYLEIEHPSEQATSADSPYLLDPVRPDGWPPMPAPKDQKDLLPDYYFLLALIHDRLLSPPQSVPINSGIYKPDAVFVEPLWNHYGRLWQGQKTQALIETALEHVEEDVGQPAQKRGRGRKYTDEQVVQLQAVHDTEYRKSGDGKASWNKAAKKVGIAGKNPGKAAEMQCRRYLRQNT